MVVVKYVLVMLLAVAGLDSALGQKRVKLKNASVLKSGRDKDGNKFQRVIGDVVFEQNKTTIYCDSAYFYKLQNQIEAFGKIRILEGDSITITGNKLEYDGNLKRAKLRNNVVFTKLATSTLYTNNLDFDRPKNLAYYFNGGKLVDSINVLTSNKGYYDLNSSLASFKKNVDVKNPNYTMTSDSLQYNSRTKVIFFRTKTNVIDKDSNKFVYEGGEYDTRTRQSNLSSGIGESPDYILVGKGYQLDGIREIYRLRGDVVMTSKKENLLIYGQSADYYKSKGISKIYNGAYMAKVTEDHDTLFITADTLVSIESQDPAKKRLLAYHNVKIFRNDLQGVADSLEYRESDSTIYFYKKPILWTEDNQMTADSIHMLLKNGTIDRIFLNVNSFVISKDSILNYNQIKGRRMVAEFQQQKISRVMVQGNGECIFYVLNEEDATMMGMNKIICSSITIRFRAGKVNNLSFYVQPEASFIPPHELKKEDITLKGFLWEENRKPKRADVVRSGQRQ